MEHVCGCLSLWNCDLMWIFGFFEYFGFFELLEEVGFWCGGGGLRCGVEGEVGDGDVDCADVSRDTNVSGGGDDCLGGGEAKWWILEHCVS